MIGTLKKLFSKSTDPDVNTILKSAKSEREALLILKESRKRDEERRERANSEIKKLSEEEQKYMDEGKQEGIASSRKMHLVRMIKQGRDQIRDLSYKVEKIYNPRLKSLQTHIQSLETVIEVRSEPVPELSDIENTAIRAKNLMEDLEQKVELVHGINSSKETPGQDREDQEILDELNTLAEEERIKKHEEGLKEKEKDDQKKSEKVSKEKPAKRKVKLARKTEGHWVPEEE